MTSTLGGPPSHGRLPDAVERAGRTSTELMEAAVVLESTGFDDRAARRHGAPDVFGLARSALWRARSTGRQETLPPVGTRPDERAVAVSRIGTRWFHLRGLLYGVPAVVALALVPSVDPVLSGLLLAGLVLSWGAGYGVTSVAWAHLGHLDVPAAHRFLRRALLIGTALTLVLSVVAVYAALIFTVSMQITLWTVLLLAGQTAYLLSAVALLMTGHELRLLIALAPASVGSLAVLAAWGPADTGGGPARAWLAASVVLAVGLAILSTGRGAAPRLALPAGAWRSAGLYACYGLLVAVLVLFPAFNELINQNYEALPLSVTLAALPLVIGMGAAESLLHRYRIDVRGLLESTTSLPEFTSRIRREVLRAHGRFAAALGTGTVLMGGLATALFGVSDPRFFLLGFDYLLLGLAIFSGMVLNATGRINVLVVTVGVAAAALVAFAVDADYLVTDTTTLLWYGAVAGTLFAVHALLVHRCVGQPASHW